jgi:hypothetical protein
MQMDAAGKRLAKMMRWRAHLPAFHPDNHGFCLMLQAVHHVQQYLLTFDAGRSCFEVTSCKMSCLVVLLPAAGERIQQLEAEVYGLMAAQQSQCMEAASAMGAAEEAGELDTFQFNGMQQGRAEMQAPGGLGAAGGSSKASLFGGGSLQLVPPTPMLQQLVQKQQHGAGEQHPAQQQQNSHSAAAAAAAAANDEDLLPGRLSFGGDGALIEPASSSGSPPIPPAAVEGMVDSPRLHRTFSGSLDKACNSPASTVSSKSLPAAALLMSQDIMDLDLVDDDLDLFVPKSPAVLRAADPMRLSMLRLSMRTDGLAASVTAAARAAAAADNAATEADGWGFSGAAVEQQPGSKGSPAGFSLPGLGQLAAGQTGDDTPPPHVGHGAAAQAAPAAVAAAAADSEGLGCEPADDMLIGSAAAGAAAAAGDDPFSAAASSLSKQAAAQSVVSVGISPLVIDATHLDPMGPVPGSDMSSAARPRRLTFAAAVCADSPSLAHDGYSPGTGSPSSSGGSVAQGCDSSTSSQQRPAETVQEQAQGQSLSLLRQRFAKLATG